MAYRGDYPSDGVYPTEEPVKERPSYNILIPVILAIILIAVILVLVNVYVNWIVLEAMYELKFGLDWFRTVFYNNYSFLVAASMPLLFINPYPGKSDISGAYDAFQFVFYRLKGQMGAPPQRSVKVWGIWQLVKYLAGFLLIFSLNGFPFFANLTVKIQMLLHGAGSWSDLARIAVLPIRPLLGTEIIGLTPSMEAQYRIFFSIAGPILIILIIRFFFKFIRDVLLFKHNAWIRDLFAILASILLIVILDAPYWKMDVTTPYNYTIALILLLSFLAGAIYFQINVAKPSISIAKRRKSLGFAIALILILLVLGNAAIIAGFRVNWNNNWRQYEWHPLTEKQIEITRWAAGIGGIEYRSLSDVRQGNESRTLMLVRQWDSEAAITKMKNQIGVNWMRLSDSDIVFITNREYWASPTTINYPSDDWISRKLIYTHASKIITIDSHTGEFVPLTAAFGIESEPSIYYGEEFYDTVYVNVRGFEEIGNASFRGDPDYTLSGWKRALWFLAEGQLGFAFNPPQEQIEMLYKRDVRDRVRSVLIYGLTSDEDVFVVTDGDRVYYCVQVYVDYPIHSRFSASRYLRFFGVVTVDVENGRMKGYSFGERDGFLLDFYRQYYPQWGPPPEWLLSQLRYPEGLLGKHEALGQLDVDFIFHVRDPFVWRSGSDFFERPEAAMVHYIMMDLMGETHYVGIQLVEYQASPGKNLAGIYIAEGSSNLGKTAFYRVANETSQLIGPSAALQALETDDVVRKQLTLLPNRRLGNILLYSVREHPYYFIPVYITTQVAESVITKLAFIVIVDALTGTKVAAGDSSASAYYSLVGERPVEERGMEDRVRRIHAAFEAAGYTVVKPEKINANLEVKIASTRYLEESQWASAKETLQHFIDAYCTPNGVTDVYSWQVDQTHVGVGILVAQEGVVRLYYFTVEVE